MLTGCFSGRTIVDSTPDGIIKIGEYTTVKAEDRVDFINFGATLPMGPDLAISPGTKFQFGSFDKGVLSGNAQYKFKIGGKIFDNYSADTKVPSLLMNITYNYPIWKTQKIGKVKIPLNPAAYTVDEHSPFFHILGIEGGVGYSAVNSESELWAVNKKNEYDALVAFEDGFPEGNANINQASVSGYIGLRYSNFINTKMSGNVEGIHYEGMRKQIIDVRLGLKPLIYSYAPDINYSYLIYESFEPDAYQEYVKLEDFLDKNYFGFHVGVSMTTFWEFSNTISMSYFWEFGVEPGYMEKYFNTAYSRIGLMIGFVPKKK